MVESKQHSLPVISKILGETEASSFFLCTLFFSSPLSFLICQGTLGPGRNSDRWAGNCNLLLLFICGGIIVTMKGLKLSPPIRTWR